MLLSIDNLRGYNILATDGEIGQVDDFYFDDQEWKVRYMVVDTGKWLPGRRVLIAPAAIGQADWSTRMLPVRLTRDQVKNSPDIDLARPVSRQQEQHLHDHYGWTVYWHGVGPIPGSETANRRAEETGDASQPPQPPQAYWHGLGPPVTAEGEDVYPGEGVAAGSSQPETEGRLRSMKEVTGYYIQATDGDIGHVDDFLVDEQSWRVHYLVVDTRNWLPGRRVLLARPGIERISWGESKVYVNLSRQAIKDSPEYDPTRPIERDYESRLHDHYHWPHYW